MIYTIKQGNHSASGINFGIHTSGQTVRKIVKFNENCKYDLANINQLDINKLYGFSVGLLTDNHYNSARFGWRWNISKQKIELLAYVYVNGYRIPETEMNLLVSEIDINQEVFTEISISEFYKFKVINNGVVTICSTPRSGSGAGYNQYPYFGGDEVAPHTMTIELR